MNDTPRFGTAGLADSYTVKKFDPAAIAAYTAGFGLTAFEYQCGRGVRLAHDKAAALGAACAERESDCVLVLSCRKGCFLRTVPAGENPALWLLDIIRRTAANKPQAEGTGFLPARRAAKKDVLPGPQPKRHPLRRVCMTLLVLALLAALAAVGAWKYTNGNFYALPEQLRALLTEHIPRPGATLV